MRHWPIIWRCGTREATGGRSAESSMARARDLSDFSRQRLFAAWPQTELWRCVNVACALARGLASPRGMIAMHGQPARGNRAQTMSKMGQLAACATSPLLGATQATSATPAQAACKRHVNERYASGIFQTPTELQARLRWRNTTRKCDGYAWARWSLAKDKTMRCHKVDPGNRGHCLARLRPLTAKRRPPGAQAVSLKLPPWCKQNSSATPGFSLSAAVALPNPPTRSEIPLDRRLKTLQYSARQPVQTSAPR